MMVLKDERAKEKGEKGNGKGKGKGKEGGVGRRE